MALISIARRVRSASAPRLPALFKGLKLPGHMGCDTVTVKNLEVVRIDEDQNLILVKGAVPGAKNGVVRVRMA